MVANIIVDPPLLPSRGSRDLRPQIESTLVAARVPIRATGSLLAVSTLLIGYFVPENFHVFFLYVVSEEIMTFRFHEDVGKKLTMYFAWPYGMGLGT